jgi:hypothetical protein
VPTSDWTCLLRLDEHRSVVSGSASELAAAVKRGADVRVYSTFDYGEHMSAPGSDVGLVQEMMNFGVTYWLEGGHFAGIQTTRYPANCSLGFGDYPSLSFFLVNDNGQAGIARPFLAPRKSAGQGALVVAPAAKYHTLDSYDGDTCSPCENYVYEFGEYGYWVSERWEEVLAHDEQGQPTYGSLKELQDAFRAGCALKVGIRNLCADLAPPGQPGIEHEVFVEMGPIYNHEHQGFLGGESQPLVRVAPEVPLAYRSGNWNFGWLIPRTDGLVHQLIVDPQTREFVRTEGRFATRWFVS